jgi:hypothetical protein
MLSVAHSQRAPGLDSCHTCLLCVSNSNTVAVTAAVNRHLCWRTGGRGGLQEVTLRRQQQQLASRHQRHRMASQ